MEIRVTYGDLLSPQTMNSVVKLTTCNLFTPKRAEKVATIANRLARAERMAYTLKSNLMEKFFEKNEKGEFVRTESVPFFKFKDAETKLEDFNNEWGELVSMSVPIFGSKIDLSELPDKIGLTPNDLTNLKKLLTLSQDFLESDKELGEEIKLS